MSRRRRNDPVGVSDNPNVVTDPERVAKGVAELRRRLTYLEQSYTLEKQLGLDMKGFNESLSRLKRAVARPRKIDVPETRLNPWLELAINIQARKLAGLAPDAPLLADHDCFVQQAAREVAERATALRGNPGDRLLRRYVEGLMALYFQSDTHEPGSERLPGESLLQPCGSPVGRLSGSGMRATLARLPGQSSRASPATRQSTSTNSCPGSDSRPDPRLHRTLTIALLHDGSSDATQ